MNKRPLERVTMRKARRAYAGAECVSPAVYKTVDRPFGERETVVDEPRVRRRAHRGESFRAWARRVYCSEPSLSPKLARIVAQGGV